MSPRMIGQTFPGQKGIKVWVQCFPWWFLHRCEIWPLGRLRWLSLTILNAVSEALLVCPCIVSRGGRTSADLCLAATQWLARRHSEQCLFVACRSLAATCVCLFKYIVSIHLRFSWMSTLLVTLEFIGISLWNLNHIRSFQIPCHTNIFSCTMEPQWWLWVFLGASESRKSVHDSMKKLFRVEAQESCLTCCSIAPAEPCVLCQKQAVHWFAAILWGCSSLPIQLTVAVFLGIWKTFLSLDVIEFTMIILTWHQTLAVWSNDIKWTGGIQETSISELQVGSRFSSNTLPVTFEACQIKCSDTSEVSLALSRAILFTTSVSVSYA